MKTAVSLPDELFDAADSLAKRLGVSRSELYASALESYLRSHRDERITETLDQVYGEESSTLNPVFAGIQNASVPRDEW
jgi:metal-responsive CopG/Arc/MetJ family transcriptional regulator